MFEMLKEYFQSKGFTGLRVNVDNILVYTFNKNDTTHVILLFNLPQGTEMSREQYEHIESQIIKACKSRSQDPVSLLTIFCSYHTELLQPLYRNNDHAAVADFTKGKLILFEGQQTDPLGIYKELDDLLFNQTRRLQMEEIQSQDRSAQEVSSDRPYTNGKKGSIAELKNKVGLITCILAGINLMIFLGLSLLGLQEQAIENFSLDWRSIIEDHEYYRLFTCMFLHADIEHVMSNMLILVVIGSKLEKLVGNIKYLFCYLSTGIIAGIVSMTYHMSTLQETRSIGASGAVFGIIGAILGIILKKRGNVEELSKRQMLLFIALSLYGGFTNQGIDNMAHVGGLVAGTLLGLILYKKTIKGA